MFKTTICALATARMNCAIHLIRMSGPNAYHIINLITDKTIDKKGYKITHANIVDNNQVIDNVLINCFVAPNSYTGEDIVEINCHGGVLIADKILSLLIKYGAQLATKGEFTKRAMMNKKIDLSQTEAINNLIHAQNELAIKGSINALSGKTSEVLKKIRNALFNLIGQIEVNIDYPEYDDVEQVTSNYAHEITNNLIKQLKELLNNSRRFIPLNEGIKILILGAPNAGKSTLLNTLTKSDKAIVSHIPGTTRDIIEASINIDDITLKLFDTAGIRTTNDEVEQLGINKAKEYLKQVDLVLLLQPINELDSSWKQQYNDILQHKHIIVYTKSDLSKSKMDLASNEVVISAINNEIDDLIHKIKKLFEVEDFSNSDMNVLQSQRQINLLEQSIHYLEQSISQLSNNVPLDLVIESYNSSLDSLNKVLGLDYEYDFLDELFKNFCLGK